MSVLPGSGRCPFCSTILQVDVSKDGKRLFRCPGDCRLWGYSETPPVRFRVKPREARRKKRRWQNLDSLMRKCSRAFEGL